MLYNYSNSVNGEEIMIKLESDYTEGAHPLILEAFVKTNMEQLSGYGNDKYCDSAKEKIKAACGRDDAQVFLLAGGTQTNTLVIDTMLASYEGFISCDTGHAACHEAGGPEFTGHKSMTVKNELGKMSAGSLSDFMENFLNDENKDHLCQPGLVYISHPTEYGTLYSKKELSELSAACKKYGLSLFLDGARLGYGLMSRGTDLTLRDIAELCDVFYIGGTKCGALCGEAVVFTHRNTPKCFFTSIKQHGALLAKGRLLGVQFDTLFTDGLYFDICAHAVKMADKLREALVEKGYEIFIETVTNQIFVTLENSRLEELRKQVSFGFWERPDSEHTVVRIATSWATREEDIDAVIDVL